MEQTPSIRATGLLGYEPRKDLLPRRPQGQAPEVLPLAAPEPSAGTGLMAALWARRSVRQFQAAPLPERQLGELLWAADGVNRPDVGGRTAPSPYGLHEIDIYVALPEAVYRFNPQRQQLELKRTVDVRNLTGYQDFVGDAPLDLVYVVNHGRLGTVPAQQRESFAAATAGAIAQNVYLYCAANGLAAVMRGWLNHRLLAEAIGLNEDEIPVLSQTVGLPAASGH